MMASGVDSGFVPSVQDFDKKLTEADAYLQILIDQLKLFDEKLQNCKDDEQRKKIKNLKETTNNMVESIKHSSARPCARGGVTGRDPLSMLPAALSCII
uniref:Uncharacterized protein n=1 Tax=Sphenodon punctatus TaxID=8508 RepID=A0A8D0GZV7_SPHPU